MFYNGAAVKTKNNPLESNTKNNPLKSNKKNNSLELNKKNNPLELNIKMRDLDAKLDKKLYQDMYSKNNPLIIDYDYHMEINHTNIEQIIDNVKNAYQIVYEDNNQKMIFRIQKDFSDDAIIIQYYSSKINNIKKKLYLTKILEDLEQKNIKKVRVFIPINCKNEIDFLKDLGFTIQKITHDKNIVIKNNQEVFILIYEV